MTGVATGLTKVCFWNFCGSRTLQKLSYLHPFQDKPLFVPKDDFPFSFLSVLWLFLKDLCKKKKAICRENTRLTQERKVVQLSEDRSDQSKNDPLINLKIPVDTRPPQIIPHASPHYFALVRSHWRSSYFRLLCGISPRTTALSNEQPRKGSLNFEC